MPKQFNPDSVLISGSMTSQWEVTDASKKSFKGHFKKPNPLSGYAVETKQKHLSQCYVNTYLWLGRKLPVRALRRDCHSAAWHTA